jgi:hypothetical protein
MNNRHFDKKKLTAFIWDGKTKYSNEKVEEEDDLKNWENFGKFIEEDESGVNILQNIDKIDKDENYIDKTDEKIDKNENIDKIDKDEN